MGSMVSYILHSSWAAWLFPTEVLKNPVNNMWMDAQLGSHTFQSKILLCGKYNCLQLWVVKKKKKEKEKKSYVTHNMVTASFLAAGHSSSSASSGSLS